MSERSGERNRSSPFSPSNTRRNQLVREWLLSGLLMAVTGWTLATLGAIFAVGTRTDLVTSFQPWLSAELVREVWTRRELLELGLPFALGTFLILLSHELGHFFAAHRRGLRTTPPYFLPAPLGVGTFGAFLKIRSVIGTRRDLVAVAAMGPLSGSLALLPILTMGVARSHPVQVEHLEFEPGSALLLTVPGRSLLTLWLTRLLYGPLPQDVILNPDPLYLAGWLGMVATMLNLLPLGQLDGGHLLYAAVGKRWHRRVGIVLILGLLVGGWFWSGWWLWAALGAVLGRRHPPLLDEAAPLGSLEKVQILACLLLFVVTFLPVPIQGFSLL